MTSPTGADAQAGGGQYLLSIMQPDGPAPEAAALARIMADVARLNDELVAAGAWVFTAGLAQPDQSRVAHPTAQGVSVTDGPFVEAREHVGGFWVITAADLAAATQWAGRAALATTLPVEVRAIAYSSLG